MIILDYSTYTKGQVYDYRTKRLNMASRDEKDLAQDVRDMWLAAQAKWNAKYQNSIYVFLTCTYRSPEEQNALYAQGRTAPGQIVTNAKAGQSHHNLYPSPAFDIAFKRSDGKILWDDSLFIEFSIMAKSCGLSWGGDWHSIKDKPHFERQGL